MTVVSLDRLYRELARQIRAYLYRSAGRNPDLADDLLHDVFVTAARRREQLARADSPRAWLFGVARKIALASGRKLQRRSLELTHDVAARSDEDPADTAFHEAIAALEPRDREILELRLREGLTYDEIAAALEIPVGTVRSRLHHAVRRLRALAGPRGKDSRSSP